MMLDKTNYEDDKMDQQKEEEERLLIVMVTINDQQLNSSYNIMLNQVSRLRENRI